MTSRSRPSAAMICSSKIEYVVSAPRNRPLSPVSAVEKTSASLLEALPGRVLGVLVDHVARHEPSDVPGDPEQATVDHGPRLLDELRVVVRVPRRPDLERGVHVAIRHGGELRLLGDGILELHGAAHLLFHQDLRDGRVRLRADPRVHRQDDRLVAALRDVGGVGGGATTTRFRLLLDVAACRGEQCEQRDPDREHRAVSPHLSSSLSPGAAGTAWPGTSARIRGHLPNPN